MKVLYYSLVLLLSANIASAQELLLGLEENPMAVPQAKKTVSLLRGLSNAPASLTLPFIDDFAYNTPYPNPDLWVSKGVYVNSNYALNMPTIGVATFDALDDNGKPYPHLTSTSSPSDSLTSLPIDLAGAPNVVMSFFYEPGGLGDMPGNNDYLQLEFYSPSSPNGWQRIWYAYVNDADSAIVENNLETGTLTVHKSEQLNDKFIYTAIAIDNPDYLIDGFRFRFTNLVSLTVNRDVPGRTSNADLWNLDFVYIDRDRDINDTNLPDVAICEPQKPLTRAYESIPATHLSYLGATGAQRLLFGETMDFTLSYRNLGWGTKNITRRFAINPLSGSSAIPEEYLGGSENIFEKETHERSYSYDLYSFSANSNADAVEYEIKSFLITDADMSPLRAALRRNDTTTYIQKFYDYYGYDDGSAENGYGLYGARTDNGRVAVQYTTYMSDSLRGLYLYFNMAKDTLNAKPFRLAVWADDNGVPGTLLYSQRIDRPVFRDSMNTFVAYKFSTPLFFSRNQKFYVGWIQLSEGFLNIGYDANRACEGKNFYSLGTNSPWLSSEYTGALMMRPIFCRAELFPPDHVASLPPATNEPTEDDFIVYPNPVSDILYIRNKKQEAEGIYPSALLIEVYNMQGALVLSNYVNDGNLILSPLRSGMYMIRIKENNKVKAVHKILVTR